MYRDPIKASPASIDGSSENGQELSKLELQVLKLVGRGLTNSETAKELGVSVKALKAHMKSIFKKLAASE
jgi:DNA-binding CsgD family transcriptional regulator